MQREYIRELGLAYDDFFSDGQTRRSPVLWVDTNHLDFVRNLEDLVWVENRIRQTLKLPPFQAELPL